MTIGLETQAPLDAKAEAKKIPPQALEAMGRYLQQMVRLDASLKLDSHKVEEATAGVLRLPEVQALKLPPAVILEAVKNVLEKTA